MPKTLSMRLLIICCISTIGILISCSKSDNTVASTPPPKKDSVPPPVIPKDSTTSSKKDTFYTKVIDVNSFNIFSKEQTSTIFLGAMTNANDLLSTKIGFKALDESRWNLERFYTDLNIDSFYHEFKPSAKNYSNFLEFIGGSVPNAFSKGQATIISTNVIAYPYKQLQSLREIFKINEDLKSILDLPYSDTMTLDTTKEFAVINMSTVLYNMMIEIDPGATKSTYTNMAPNSSDWNQVFINTTPKFVSTISYGYSSVLIFESPTKSQLAPLLNKYLGKGQYKILDGTALTELTSDEQNILKKSHIYGINMGQGRLSTHDLLEGINETLQYRKNASSNTSTVGIPISYTVDNASRGDAYKTSFSITYK